MRPIAYNHLNILSNEQINEYFFYYQGIKDYAGQRNKKKTLMFWPDQKSRNALA